jgi:hypothetical protein
VKYNDSDNFDSTKKKVQETHNIDLLNHIIYRRILKVEDGYVFHSEYESVNEMEFDNYIKSHKKKDAIIYIQKKKKNFDLTITLLNIEKEIEKKPISVCCEDTFGSLKKKLTYNKQCDILSENKNLRFCCRSDSDDNWKQEIFLDDEMCCGHLLVNNFEEICAQECSDIIKFFILEIMENTENKTIKIENMRLNDGVEVLVEYIEYKLHINKKKIKLSLKGKTFYEGEYTPNKLIDVGIENECVISCETIILSNKLL